ncbi:MAG: hypothetical protein JW940_00060 [Polyangiaceae bacterium]|nr:hypothetical protein [Polyangiaceae bacterium]
MWNQLQRVPQRVGQAYERRESGIGVLGREQATDNLGFRGDRPSQLGLAHAESQARFVEAADQLINGIDLASAFSVGLGEGR